MRHLYNFQIGDKVRVAKVVGFRNPITAKASQSKSYTKTIYSITGRVGRRYICTNPKNGATTERMGYEMMLIDSEPLEFKPTKDSVYTQRPMTGKEAKAAKMQRLIDLELQREGIKQANITARPKRTSTINDSLASQAEEFSSAHWRDGSHCYVFATTSQADFANPF